MKKCVIAISLLLGLGVLAAVARADNQVEKKYLDIGTINSVPTKKRLLVDISASDPLLAQVKSVIEADFTLSGSAIIVPPESGADAAANADFEVTGVWADTPEGKRLAYQLIDRRSQKAVLSKTLSLQPGKESAQGHFIADTLYEGMNQIRGIFSTRQALVVQNGLKWQIQVADWKATEARTVFRSDYPIISPAWSADGRNIAFAMKKPQQNFAIYILSLDTGHVSALLNQVTTAHSAPAWSKDGKYLAFSMGEDGSRQLYIKDMTSGKVFAVNRPGDVNTEPSFSPDGKMLAYTSNREGSLRVYVYDLENKSERKLPDQCRSNYSPKWYPDGKALSYVCGEGANLKIRIQSLTDETDMREVSLPNGHNDSPSVAPNGMQLAFLDSNKVRILGNGNRPVQGGGYFATQVREISWGPLPN